MFRLFRFDRKRAAYVALAIVFLFGAVVRLWPVIGDRPLWYDEVRTWQTAYFPSWQQFFMATVHREHPPLSYLFVRGFMEFFGSANFVALRMPSLLFGLLCIPAAFALGKSLISVHAGILLALFVTLDGMMIDQSQQARMYTLFMLLLLLALRQLAIAVHAEPGGYRQWAILGLLLGLLGWTHHLSMIVWPGFAAGMWYYLFRSHPESGQVTGHRVKQVTLAVSLAIAADIPPLFQLVRRLNVSGQSVLPEGSVVAGIGNMLSQLLGTFPVYLIIIVIASTGLVMLYRYGNRHLAITLAVIAVLSFAAQFPLAQKHHQFSARYLLPLLVFVWVGLASAIVYAARGPVRAAIAVFVVLYGFNSFTHAVASSFDELNEKYLYGVASDFVMDVMDDQERVIFYPLYYMNFRSPYASLHGRTDEYDVVNPEGNVRTELLKPFFDGGVWVVLLPEKLLKDSRKGKESVAGFARMAGKCGLDFRLTDIAHLPARKPLIFHFTDNAVGVWQILPVDGLHGKVVRVEVRHVFLRRFLCTGN